MTNLDQLPVAALPALPLPILQVNGAASPTTTSDGSIGLLLVDDNHHHRIPLLAALQSRGIGYSTPLAATRQRLSPESLRTRSKFLSLERK
jgi:hypothetical protein